MIVLCLILFYEDNTFFWFGAPCAAVNFLEVGKGMKRI